MSGAYPEPLAAGAPADALRKFLENVSQRREFRMDRAGAAKPGAPIAVPGLHLTGAQTFIRDFAGPDTGYSRLLVKWQTGAGKSIAAISTCHAFVQQFRARAALGDSAPTITVLSFTARETIQEDMLRYPEFGFASAAEVEELRRLRAEVAAPNPPSASIRQLAGFLGVLRRRITDRARGGYYRFYGYKEFANRLFRTTRAASARGFDPDAALFARRGLGAQNAAQFGARIDAAVGKGDIEIDTGLLNSLRDGMLVCDEIHNVYNIMEPNNYGMAIQYALDTLGAAAPRALLMSATPITGSAAEIVDLLNLLVPRSELPEGALRRADFFRPAGSELAAKSIKSGLVAPSDLAESRLLPDALERIGRLSAGRVSFLLDSDVEAYPVRIFEGETLAGVPYLKFTPCEMSDFHRRTLAREQKEAQERRNALTKSPENIMDIVADSDTIDEELDPDSSSRGLAVNAYALNDLAFPNPEFPGTASPAYGLYRSNETLQKLAAAPEAWRQAAGVSVESVAGRGGSRIATGAWLHRDRIGQYSAKFSRLLADLLDCLRAGPGKIMVYHHRVHTSGVLLLAEMLRMNGIADEGSEPAGETLCAICGVAQNAHTAETHAYAPARFAIAHSDIDRAEMLRSIASFNAPENLQGQRCRILIGSKVIREGLNFRAVRHLLVASMPTDFPTLLQVFGRVVRKNSHADLPRADRNVRIRIYVSTGPDVTPELQRYRTKGHEFLTIQAVERALHIGAVDGFINYSRVQRAMRGPAHESSGATLDALPYAPLLDAADAFSAQETTSTYDAYEFGPREVAGIAAACRALFAARPVWTYEDLWGAVRTARLVGPAVDSELYAEDNFAAALVGLRRPAAWRAGGPVLSVVRAGRFYIATAVGAEFDAAGPRPPPTLDIESYWREPAAAGPSRAHVSVSIAQYVRESRTSSNFVAHVREFERRYGLDGAKSGDAPDLAFALVEFGGAFHIEMLRRLVEGERVTEDDARLRDLYRRYRIAIAAGAAGKVPAAARAVRGLKGGRDAIVGYATADAVRLFDPSEKRWFSAPLSEFGYGKRHRENPIVVGFVVGVESGAGAKFKLRPSLQRLQRSETGALDVRTVARGAVCETRPREELDQFARQLRTALASAAKNGLRADSAGAVQLRMQAATQDRSVNKRFPSAAELCDTIRTHLLALEEIARGDIANGTRWVYLFSDRPPSIAALGKA